MAKKKGPRRGGPPPRKSSPWPLVGVGVAVAALLALAVRVATLDPHDGPPAEPTPVAAPTATAPADPAPSTPPSPAPSPTPVATAEPAEPAEDEPADEEPYVDAAGPAYATAWVRGATEEVQVARAIDGDTLELSDGRRVRLVGINTPERDRPLYQEAKQALKELVEGQTVLLEFDEEQTDQYKRTLAYVHKDDLFVNGEIVRRGLAYCYTWEPNTAHQTELVTFQREARAEARGLWGLPAPAPAELYVADRRGHRFHRPACGRVRRISAGRRLEFPTRAAALDAGQNPCDECQP